ncbi:unnamed protein product [Cladocopium goreaui]|uniref:Probable protein phosphatase 2C 71 (AtPP2C71) n=1 Tax=Cladocopium goreaui TaxID=2562237 RepID=A0A9P1CYV0_9DINO|nr:unnamed protein product [Cladocopium goreaui]
MAAVAPQHICYLCTRKFTDAAALKTHEQYSQLHQQNLDRQDGVIRQHKEEVISSVNRLRQQLHDAVSSSNPVTSSRAGAIETQLRQQIGEFSQAQEAIEYRRAGSDPAKQIRNAQAGTFRATRHEMRCGRLHFEVGAACWQGGKEMNEDRFVLDIELLSSDGLSVPGIMVLDGHSGSRCVDHLVERLPAVLQARVASKPLLSDDFLREAVVEACAMVDEEFLTWARQQEAMDGSTLLLALIYETASQPGKTRLLVANVGDSRGILCRATAPDSSGPQGLQVFRLSEDHKPNREDERQRIEALGGTVDLHGVWRVICPEQVVFGGRTIARWGLAVSRAFGDLLLKEPYKYGCTKVLPGQLVSAEPELRLVELDPSLDRFVVLACDGIWDVLQDQDAGAVCAGQCGVELAAHCLVKHAFAAGSMDNLTAVVLTWCVCG